ncbi:uncharacterized protein [Drosophila pseudoobscura]|uniref:Uncharacterized protein n=1 Tax=Drosophila pseudoobscura pseudoobscura TaxID=46245 RepID=A0A6I8UF61_DROPS|nr:uncharacterized protein LOC4815399 [Drosophila pseudoobscura]
MTHSEPRTSCAIFAQNETQPNVDRIKPWAYCPSLTIHMEAIATWTLALLRLMQLLHWSTALGPYALGAEQRPLWILEDGLAKRQREERAEADYATTTRKPVGWRRHTQEPGSITFLVRHEERPAATRAVAASLPQRRFMMPQRLQLPHQYVQQRRASPSRTRSLRRLSHQRRHLPVFDNGPGDNALAGAEHPIFIYNGTRGEMILNTMLSGQRYPMQEPVPGQVLYPPSTPMFRPKPIVERFRMPGQRQLLNLTLIPFYAHEAITSTSSTTTELPPTTPLPTSYETQLPRSQKKRKRKKAKQYNAFHSPQEVVQWQSVLRRSTGDNHRHSSGSDAEQQLEEEEEPQEEETQVQNWLTEDDPPEAVEEVEQQEISTSTSVSPFQIVYFDESLERPESDALDSTTISPPQRLSSRYALKREYYAFPVYTLGKLLQPQHQSQSQLQIESQVEEKQEKIERSARSSSEQAPSTWFILNSRYKGPHHRWPGMGTDNHTKYYTSKYIESAFRPRR